MTFSIKYKAKAVITCDKCKCPFVLEFTGDNESTDVVDRMFEKLEEKNKIYGEQVLCTLCKEDIAYQQYEDDDIIGDEEL